VERRAAVTTRWTALLMLLALGLAACTSDGGDATPAEVEEAAEPEAPADTRAGGTLRMGLSVAPASIDPRFLEDAEGELVVGAVFEPLVRLDPQQRVVPGLAQRWEHDDDGRTWTFHLRDASFHDGSPVTADDVARTFHRIADGTASPRSFLAYLLEPVAGIEEAQADGDDLEGVEVVDERTLRLHLDRPEPGYVRTLAHPALAPVPAIADEDPEAFARRPVGNGPFSVAEPVEPGGFIRLARHTEHRTEPLLDAVVLQAYADDGDREQQWQDLLDGQLHVAEVPVDRMQEAVDRFGRSADGYRGPGLLSGITSTVYLYGFDLTVEPFDDPRVRRAISLSIDRERIAEEVFDGARRAADAIVPPPVPGSQAGACDHCRHDPAGARQLLDEAEEATGAQLDELTLTYNQGRTHTAIAERMAADIEDALDIQVSLDGLDLRRFLEAVRGGEATVFRLGLDPHSPDPGAYLHPLLHSSSIGIENLVRYADDEVDELLDEARLHDGTRAVELWQQAEQRALEDVAVVPLLNYRHNRVVADGVRDLYWSPFGRLDLARTWLDDA
jgi:oligopeptide transport system substrate-binding protein